MGARQNGFTLIELLVAISILAIVAVLGWRGLDSIIRAREKIHDEMEKTRRVQLVYAQIQSDLQHLSPNAELPGRTTFVADNGNMTLIRTSVADAQMTRYSVVTYRFHDGMFARHESPATRDMQQLDQYWATALNDPDPKPSIALQSEIEAVTMRSFRDGAWTATILPPNSGEDIPSSPTAVEVEIFLKDHHGSLLKLFLAGTS